MKTPNNKAQASNFLTDREKMGGTSHQTSEKEMGSETTEQKQLKTYLGNKEVPRKHKKYSQECRTL